MIFPNKNVFPVDTHTAVNIDVVKFYIRNPDLFVEFLGERVFVSIKFEIFKLEIFIKPLCVNHELDIKGSLNVIDVKYFQYDKGSIERQQLLLVIFELNRWHFL